MSSPIPATTTPARLVLALLAAVGTGVLVALQTRINGELGQRLGDGFLAAVISFGSGLVVLALGLLVWRPGRRGVARVVSSLRSRDIPWWLVIGGAGGALFVLGQGLTVGMLGVAVYTIAVVCGQTLSSLVLDHRGLARMPARPATPQRVIGAALAILAVGIALSDRLRPDIPVWALVVPLVAGLLVGFQQAVNGQVRDVAGSAYAATFVNFLIGSAVLVAAFAVHTAVAPTAPTFPAEWWLYLGGVNGCLFIAAQTVIVRWTGVLLMGLAVLGGQLVASVVFDVLAPVSGDGLHLVTVVGTGLVLVAVLIASIPARRQRSVSR
jgi:Uncharacterized protein conserved in bacteria